MLTGTLSHAAEPDSIEITIHTSKEGPTINRHISGQFAEHLGRGIYESIWESDPTPISPNTRGIRKDVVEALKTIKVPPEVKNKDL